MPPIRLAENEIGNASVTLDEHGRTRTRTTDVYLRSPRALDSTLLRRRIVEWFEYNDARRVIFVSTANYRFIDGEQTQVSLEHETRPYPYDDWESPPRLPPPGGIMYPRAI